MLVAVSLILGVLWLTVVIVLVATCRMAARGDALPAQDTDNRPVPRYRLPEPKARLALVQDLRGTRGPRLTGHGV